MPVLLKTILQTGLKLIAGIGIAELLDRFVRPKVLEYYPETISPITKESKPIKIVWFVAAFIAAFILVRFIARKMNISLLK